MSYNNNIGWSLSNTAVVDATRGPREQGSTAILRNNPITSTDDKRRLSALRILLFAKKTSDLLPIDLAVMAYLILRADECSEVHHPQGVIAVCLNVGRDTILRSLARLAAAGIIEKLGARRQGVRLRPSENWKGFAQ